MLYRRHAMLLGSRLVTWRDIFCHQEKLHATRRTFSGELLYVQSLVDILNQGVSQSNHYLVYAKSQSKHFLHKPPSTVCASQRSSNGHWHLSQTLCSAAETNTTLDSNSKLSPIAFRCSAACLTQQTRLESCRFTCNNIDFGACSVSTDHNDKNQCKFSLSTIFTSRSSVGWYLSRDMALGFIANSPYLYIFI